MSHSPLPIEATISALTAMLHHYRTGERYKLLLVAENDSATHVGRRYARPAFRVMTGHLGAAHVDGAQN